MEYALVTGASKGIGKAIATVLAQKGHNLILIARSGNLLDQLSVELKEKYKIECVTFATDLSMPDAAKKLFELCMNQKLSINILVNNAGYGLWGTFENLTLDDQQNMMQLNMQTLVSITHYFIPVLKQNKRAWILNLSSTASFQAVPGMSVYAASKIFVLSFTRALHYEYKNSNISVSCLIPGTTDTGFMDRAGMDALKDYAEKFNMAPEVVARQAVEGMFNGTLEIIPGLTNKVSAIGTKFLPKKMIEKIAAGIYLKRLKSK